MAGVINKRPERSLSELLDIFRAPFSEDHSWAICHQCARKLQKLSNDLCVADIPTLSLNTVFVTRTGSVELKKTNKLHVRSSESSEESSYQSMQEVISDLGLLVYDLLDYGLDDDEERALPKQFEHLIDCMTSEDDTSCTSDIESDCDSDSDQILGIIRSSTKSISLLEIIQVCESQVSSSVSTETHYQLMCKRLFEEANELVSLAAEESDEVQDKLNHRKKWTNVLKDVEIGTSLKKVLLTITDSTSSPVLSAHEIVQLSVKSFLRVNLKPVLMNNTKEARRITDPHMMLMQEIRAIKPNLRPVSERAKGHCMARALTPMEILMEEIRTPPILRRVHNSYTTMSDGAVDNSKKKLMPSIDLVADLSEEPIQNYLCPVPAVSVADSLSDLRYSSCTELSGGSTAWGKPRSRSSPCSPDPTRLSASQRYISPLCSTQSNITTQSSVSMNAVEVEGACLEFKSISFSGMNGADSCSFYRQQLYHSCNSVDALGGGRTMEESDSGAESASHDARSLQSDDELPSSTKELIQICHILSKADLVNLQLSDNKTYREITRGKLCSACKRRRFSLMARAHKCIVCQKLVCGKCVSKMTLSPDDLPGDHPAKLLEGRKNSNDACIPCKDFITSGGATNSHQQVPVSDTSHSSSDY